MSLAWSIMSACSSVNSFNSRGSIVSVNKSLCAVSALLFTSVVHFRLNGKDHFFMGCNVGMLSLVSTKRSMSIALDSCIGHQGINVGARSIEELCYAKPKA